MTFRWIQVIQLVLVTSVFAFETSEEYLRKAMHELQGIQAPLYTNYPFFAGKRYSRTANILQVQQDTKPGYPPKKSEPEVSQYYSQMPLPMPVVVSDQTNMPELPLGFTKNELAMMYNQALQSGNAINLPGLKNSLESGQIPTIVGNHLHIPDSSQQQQQFAYYFYPLRSFMDTLQSNNGYKTINDLTPQQSVQESQKQIIINPLFMAISSFVGMALVFMFGVIVLPRILGEFRSRVVHDELLNLTTNVNAAIDKYELTTTRPKTPFEEAMVGIKTRPVQRVKRKKIQRNRTVI
ncbi:uncharacterized protein LOC123271407 isoform X1 [Cotesia glomerata]|uniref:Uncharacterized protein n=2 Tax=Cotesia glomerata TaxID=32391 RepID=A0AAV7IRX7_COTGL|nr:uncharacterized protein LOC123271407 isoform X1 [Cotesia glomerata]KAH0558056.1 hypothetical protein KQX54_014103 [Cotesia glomerata]